MNILITNDDGIASQGILALEKHLSQEYNTYLIAPLKEKSCTSMAMTLFMGMRVEKVNDNHYIVDGYPVDCVNIGLYSGIFPPIDLVISGINRGVNMGYDVHYSGTVGAARHAAIHGVLAIAVSSVRVDPEDGYDREAIIIKEFLKQYKERLSKYTIYNINFPEQLQEPGDLSLLTWTLLGRRKYVESYEKKHIIGGISEFTIHGSQLGSYLDPGTDFEAFYQGKIPISAVKIDATDKEELNRWVRL